MMTIMMMIMMEMMKIIQTDHSKTINNFRERRTDLGKKNGMLFGVRAKSK